jgi:hypothetical protein
VKATEKGGTRLELVSPQPKFELKLFGKWHFALADLSTMQDELPDPVRATHDRCHPENMSVSEQRKGHGCLKWSRQDLRSITRLLHLISGVALCVGFALTFCFFAGFMNLPNWFTTANYGLATIFVGVVLTYSYRLLTAKGRVVVSIDAEG